MGCPQESKARRGPDIVASVADQGEGESQTLEDFARFPASPDSESDVAESFRKATIAWGKSILEHWSSGAEGRATRPVPCLTTPDE